jgi:hypothetical protein
MAMARWHAGGVAPSRLGEGGREEGGKGCVARWAGSVHWARWPLGQRK